MTHESREPATAERRLAGMPAAGNGNPTGRDGARNRTSAFGAVMLWTICAAAIAWLASMDHEWKRGHDLALRSGDLAKYAGDYNRARLHYERAVRFNPYSSDAHFRLAILYDRRLASNENALRHFLYARKYDPDHPAATIIDDSAESLELIRSGMMEDPMDALADMEAVVEAGNRDLFRERLASELYPDADAYFQAWRERGAGTLAYRRLVRGGGGDWRAVLDLDFADGTTMSIHFRSVPGRHWRMSLSFP